MNKTLIKSNFSKAINTYNEESFVQNCISSKLINMILKHINNNYYKDIFEFGCGTGLYTRKIIEFLKFNTLIINDICENINIYLKDINNDNIKLLIGDVENLIFPKNLSLITSASVLQWLTNIQSFFDKCYNCLINNGVLAFSTFGIKNLIQLKSIINVSLKYYNLEELINLLKKNYKIIFYFEEEININFKSTVDLLNHFKKTGTVIPSNFNWTKGKLEKFNNEYKRLYSKNDIYYLTYNPIYIIAQKNES